MTKLKSALLNSRSARRILEHRAESVEFARLFRAIDQINDLYDSLHVLHTTADPTLTRQSKALKYKGQYDRAMEATKRATTTAVSALVDLEEQATREAEREAGFHKLGQDELQEIRTALRAMTIQQRDQAIKEAAEKGDAAILQAIRSAPSPVLVGQHNLPIDTLMDHALAQVRPDLPQLKADIKAALGFLDGAVTAFAKDTAAMREPHLEEAAARSARESEAAESKLSAAVGSV